MKITEIKANVDAECLCCKRFYSKSCQGVKDRKREKVVLENSCSGHLFVDNESDCFGDEELYDDIKKTETEIGLNW